MDKIKRVIIGSIHKVSLHTDMLCRISLWSDHWNKWLCTKVRLSPGAWGDMNVREIPEKFHVFCYSSSWLTCCGGVIWLKLCDFTQQTVLSWWNRGLGASHCHQDFLTHWPLVDITTISNMSFSNSLYRTVAWELIPKLLSGECHIQLLVQVLNC